MRLKNIILSITIVILSVGLLSGFNKPHLEPKSKTLVFAGDDNFAPYSYFSRNTATGYTVDLMTELAGTVYSFTSKNIRIKLMPWEKCIKGLKSGEIDGLIGAPVDSNQKKYMMYSAPIARIEFAIFVEESNRYVNSLDSLEGTLVAIPKESPVISTISEDKHIQIIETSTVQEALEKLKNREVIAVVAQKNVALYYIQQQNMEGLKVVGHPVGPSYEYSIAVRKKETKLLKDINLGLESLKEKGTLLKLKRKWFGLTLLEPFPWKFAVFATAGISLTVLLLSGLLWVISLNATVKAKTEQIRLMSQRMVEKDKLAVLGKLAGQIAHELRTPLSIIHNSVFLLRKESSGDKALFEKRLRLLEDKVRLTSNILESILSYSRVKAEIATTISVKECVEEALKDLDIPEGISAEIKIEDEKDLMVFMDFHQLYSVIRNLMLNSVQAMNKEGVLKVEAYSDESDSTVCVRVSDTGKGIAENVKNKIFNLFYSSKITGTGLGLPISKSIIEANEGQLMLEETNDDGTTFLVKLPSTKKILKRDEEKK